MSMFYIIKNVKRNEKRKNNENKIRKKGKNETGIYNIRDGRLFIRTGS